MKSELFNYLKSFMIESDWNSGNTAKQARAIFTTLCFVGGIMADTHECNLMLWNLYTQTCMDKIMYFDVFVNYMVGLIV